MELGKLVPFGCPAFFKMVSAGEPSYPSDAFVEAVNEIMDEFELDTDDGCSITLQAYIIFLYGKMIFFEKAGKIRMAVELVDQ